jgi:uncharacterized protein YdcH (DUF465 family)
MSLRKVAIELQVDFEMSFNKINDPDWKKIVECNNKLDEKIEQLNISIREHIYGKLLDTKPITHP